MMPRVLYLEKNNYSELRNMIEGNYGDQAYSSQAYSQRVGESSWIMKVVILFLKKIQLLDNEN
jgi:DNA primase catalytic subunit